MNPSRLSHLKNDPPTKICSKCRKELPITEFGIRSYKTASGEKRWYRLYLCNHCKAKWEKERYQKYKAKFPPKIVNKYDIRADKAVGESITYRCYGRNMYIRGQKDMMELIYKYFADDVELVEKLKNEFE